MALFGWMRSRRTEDVAVPIAEPVLRKSVATDDPSVAATVESDTIQLVEEQAIISKRAVEGETLRVRTLTDSIEEVVETQLRKENYDVVRIAVDQVVDNIPEIRREDGVTIIPVMEERLVVTKQLVLREELHIREDHDVVTHTEPVVLRKQRAIVERNPADTA